MDTNLDETRKQLISKKLETCKKHPINHCNKLRRIFKLKQRHLSKPAGGFKSLYTFLFATVICSSIYLSSPVKCLDQQQQQETSIPTRVETENAKDLQHPSNHKMSIQELDHDHVELKDNSDSSKSERSTSGRRGRQYDGLMSTSSANSDYASVPGDGYLPQSTMSSSRSAAGYSNGGSSVGYGSDMGPPGAYPSMESSMYQYGRSGFPSASASAMPPIHAPPVFGTHGLFGGGLFPMMGAKGFDIAEVVCTAIAVAIGAVIIGAPFILLYLFVMNQMNGNGAGGLSGAGPGGSISLTGPSASTTVNGRKKRHTSFPEALFMHLSPLVNNEQVVNTFKTLMKSIAKYQA